MTPPRLCVPTFSKLYRLVHTGPESSTANNIFVLSILQTVPVCRKVHFGSAKKLLKIFVSTIRTLRSQVFSTPTLFAKRRYTSIIMAKAEQVSAGKVMVKNLDRGMHW